MKPIARWWWPGGSVSQEKIAAELAELSSAGFGGIEIQPFTFGLNFAELEEDALIHSVGSENFLELLAFAFEEGAKLGLEMDVTLGSGWPGGAPSVGENRAEELLLSWYDVEGGQSLNQAPPALGAQDYVGQVQQIIDALDVEESNPELYRVVAARIVDGVISTEADNVLDISSKLNQEVLRWEAPEGTWRVFSLARNKVGHVAVGAAFPKEDGPAWVFDHLSSAGTASFLEGYGEKLMSALAPDAMFVDSFEMIGQLPWTEDFLAAFQNKTDYDLTPYLPFVFLNGGETKYGGMFDSEPSALFPSQVGARIREDYEDVRASLFLSECIEPMQKFATENNTKMRLQAHGGYGHVLDAYALADIPEAEGLFAGGSMDFLKLASSAAHVAGRPVVTSESFVSVNLENAALSAQDLYLLSARAFVAGINRLVFHGFAYDYPTADGRRWFPFAPAQDRVSAGPLRITSEFTAEHDIWPELNDFTLYVSRMGEALTQGEHMASIAWLMPEREVADSISLVSGGVAAKSGESDISSFIHGQGFDYDRVSPEQLLTSSVMNDALSIGNASYSILLVDGFEAADPAWLAKILEVQDSGVPVVWIGELPSRARGYYDHTSRDASVSELNQQLEQNVIMTSLSDLGLGLEQTAVEAPLTTLDDEWLRVSATIRMADEGYIIALCNEYDRPLQDRFQLALEYQDAKMMDPMTGEVSSVDGETLTVSLEPGRCQLLVTRSK